MHLYTHCSEYRLRQLPGGNLEVHQQGQRCKPSVLSAVAPTRLRATMFCEISDFSATDHGWSCSISAFLITLDPND